VSDIALIYSRIFIHNKP